MQIQSNIFSAAADMIKAGESSVAGYAILQAMKESGNEEGSGFCEYVNAIKSAGYQYVFKNLKPETDAMFLDFMALANK